MVKKIDPAVAAGAKLRLYGERVALSEVEEVNADGLALPAASQYKANILAQVVAVGDGRLPNGETRLMWPKVGDVVFIQMNPMLAKTMAQKVDNQPLFVLHQNDCIARVHYQIVNYTNFQPLGRWVFVRAEFPKMAGELHLPDGDIHGSMGATFIFEKGGPAVGLGLEQGQVIYVDKTRLNPLKLDGVNYGYIDRDSVLGFHHEDTS